MNYQQDNDPIVLMASFSTQDHDLRAAEIQCIDFAQVAIIMHASNGVSEVILKNGGGKYFFPVSSKRLEAAWLSALEKKSEI